MFSQEKADLDTEKQRENSDTTQIAVKTEQPSVSSLLYRVWDNPPLAVSLVVAIQVCVQLVSTAVTNSILISTAICGNSHVTAKLMSTNMFMSGLTTVIQATVGVRLPVFQAPSIYYVVPLLTRADMPDWVCSNTEYESMYNTTNGRGNMTVTAGQEEEVWRTRLMEVSGVLMTVSVLHALIGASGLGGLVAKVITPLTIVPAVVVIILKILETLIKFALVHIGVSVFTLVILLILTTYLANVLVPLPYWTPWGGWQVTRSRFLRTYAVLISIGAGWLLCHILTVTGALTDDPEDRGFKARTDSQLNTITMAKWFYFPYPGQFGTPTFSLTLFFGLFVAMLSSVIDSVADYTIVSRVCQIPKPPPHATNRGLLIEGACSILSGAFGAGMATSTTISVTGSVAITGVTSRRVFQLAGVLLMSLGIVGKIGAFFVIIPRPVIGAAMLIILASITGVLLAELNDYDMKKPRNCMTIGLSILLGSMIPKMILHNQNMIDTGNSQVNHLIIAMFGTPLFVAGVIACFLDNTLPGGRGQKPEDEDIGLLSPTSKQEKAVHDLPYVHNFFERCKWTRFCPILPGFGQNRKEEVLIESKSYA